MIAAFARDAARKRFDPWAERYSVIRPALDSCTACAGCDSIKMARIIQRISSSQFMGGTRFMGMNYLNRALGLFERNDSPDSLNLAYCLWTLRGAHNAAQEFDKAQNLTERVAQIVAANDAKNIRCYPTIGMVTLANGQDWMSLGEPAKALAYMTDAVQILTREDSTACIVAQAHGMLAECLRDLGSAEDVEQHYQKAVRLWSECGENNPPYFLVSTLTSLGAHYREINRLEDAESTFQRALYEAKTQNLPTWQNAYAYLLLEIAKLYQAQNKLDLSREYYWSALDLAEQIHPPGDGRLTEFQLPFADMLFDNGDWEAAMTLQVTALDLAARTYGPHHPKTDDAREGLAWMEMRRPAPQDSTLVWWNRDNRRALQLLEVAFNERRMRLEDAAAVLPEYELIETSESFHTTCGRYMDALFASELDSGRLVEASKVVYGGKAQVWETLLERKQIEQEVENQYSDTLRKLQEMSQRTIKLAARFPSDSLLMLADTLWHRRVHFEHLIEKENDAFRRFTNWQLASSNDVAVCLDDTTATIDYLRYNMQVTAIKTESHYAAFVNRSRGGPFLVNLGDCKVIDELVREYTEQLASLNDLDTFEFNEVSAELYDRLWRPIEASLNGISRVFVSPDGELNSISFPALREPGGRYLVEDFTISYLSSGRDMIRIRNSKPRPQQGHGWLVVANPAFDDEHSLPPASLTTALQPSSVLRSSLNPLNGSTWTSLPGTRVEAQWARSWAANEEVHLLMEEDATKSNVESLAPDSRVLYFATHGFSIFNPNRTTLLPANQTHLARMIRRDPLLASGVVLAGAGSDSPNAIDGLWTAEEIANLNLSGVDLAILSACATGTGKIVNGEGVYAVRRGFELAGVKATLSTLWRIDDTATVALMKAVARHVDQPVSFALTLAMRDELTRRRKSGESTHPFFWGGFVYSGDWNVYATLRGN
ncbi:MAG: CHAT domain-containing protein [Calditrichaeota bacterium]|nr:CHAT domain-containing protein [Calditrichota bacterium]